MMVFLSDDSFGHLLHPLITLSEEIVNTKKVADILKVPPAWK